MQNTEIIEGGNGRRGKILTSFSNQRACLDWYLEAGPQHLGKVLGGEGPFPIVELETRLAKVRAQVQEAVK